MSSNKAAKEELIRRYGAKCFIERLKLRDTSGLKYSGKNQYKRMKMLTYHHIIMRCKGGKATLENGALLSAENHAWFHQLPKEKQEELNRMFQELKLYIDNNYEECEIQLLPEKEIELPADLNVMTVNFEKDNEGNVNIKPQKKAKKKYNRAKNKRKTKRIIKRYYGGER